MKDRIGSGGSFALSAVALILFVILGEAVGRGATLQWDIAISSMVHGSAGPSLTSFAVALSFLGRLLVLLPATAVMLVWLVLARRRSSALALGIAMGGALLLNWVLKNAFHRVRPQPFFGVDPGSFSFPSGHVLLAFSFYGAILLILNSHRKLPPLAFAFGVALVLAIAWSRVYLGVHYASDVVAGFLVAISWLAALIGLEHFSLENSNSRA